MCTSEPAKAVFLSTYPCFAATSKASPLSQIQACQRSWPLDRGHSPMEVLPKLYLSSLLFSSSCVSTTASVLMPPVVCTLPRDPAECSRQRKERMSSFPPGLGQLSHLPSQLQYATSSSRWSLNDLSTELLALIFEQVCGTPRRLLS